MELLEPLPAGSELASGRNRAASSRSRPGQTVRWSYEVRCAAARPARAGRGRRPRPRPLGPPHLGAAPRRRASPCASIRASLRCGACRGPSTSRRRRSATTCRRRSARGSSPATSGSSRPGDRIKQVNWRASLRLGTLYVTQHHRERNADVVLMLDTLAEVGRAPDTTLDLGVRAAASLATGYLARKDRVGLINYGGLIHWVRPGPGGSSTSGSPTRCPGRASSSPTWPRTSPWCRRGCCHPRPW